VIQQSSTDPKTIQKENVGQGMGKTTPETVEEANLGLYHSKMNLPQAAAHCGMTHREMKMTFREFLKHYKPEERI
jgi:hypothetical protein